MPDPQLLHGVGLGRVVEVHLHGGRAQHHVEREPAASGQVLAHDRVTLLGHELVIRTLRERVKAEAEPLHPELARARCELSEVRVDLVGDPMHRRVLGAGELELAAGLQGDGRTFLQQRQGRTARNFTFWLPAVSLQRFEEADDAGGAVVIDRTAVCEHPELFHLASEHLLRLLRGGERQEQLFLAHERSGVGKGIGHGAFVPGDAITQSKNVLKSLFDDRSALGPLLHPRSALPTFASPASALRFRVREAKPSRTLLFTLESAPPT